MDIVWLQRDFGLYIVNMFDTGQAARLLCTLSVLSLLRLCCLDSAFASLLFGFGICVRVCVRVRVCVCIYLNFV